MGELARLPERMQRKIRVAAADQCWIWVGYRDRDGYGRVSVNAVGALAHRVVYTRLIGSIPPGLTIDHLCRNRACVNPHHMEPVTQTVNYVRGYQARRREREGAAHATCLDTDGCRYTEEDTDRG